jgi:hypothetical protein
MPFAPRSEWRPTGARWRRWRRGTVRASEVLRPQKLSSDVKRFSLSAGHLANSSASNLPFAQKPKIFRACGDSAGKKRATYPSAQELGAICPMGTSLPTGAGRNIIFRCSLGVGKSGRRRLSNLDAVRGGDPDDAGRSRDLGECAGGRSPEATAAACGRRALDRGPGKRLASAVKYAK